MKKQRPHGIRHLCWNVEKSSFHWTFSLSVYEYFFK